MSNTVVFKVVLGQHRDAPVCRREPPPVLRKPPPRPLPAGDAPPTSRIARQLALAYVIRDAIAVGQVRDYREAARRLGLCHPQVTHIMGLLHLAPDIQVEILMGRLVGTERRMRPVCQVALWDGQREVLKW